MNADCYFTMGKSHMVCQDYAYAGKNNQDNCVAIVSDGCSASPDSDFGSRFLVRSALICGEKMNDVCVDDIDLYGDILARTSIGLASDFVSGLRLNPYCLDATLLYLEEKDNYINVVMVGDGVFFAQRKDGSLEVKKIDFQSGCPFYPSYFLNKNRYEIYLNEDNLKNTIEDWEVDNNTTTLIKQEECQIEVKSFSIAKKDYNFVGLFSDGIFSFDIDWVDVLKDLTAFKNYKGKFVKRRMRKFFKWCTSEDVLPKDDVSMAVINMRE